MSRSKHTDPRRIRAARRVRAPYALRGQGDRHRGHAWDGGRLTVVTWPEGWLRDFMLFDVLLHEIGHHIVQQYTGKRPARVARTRDHEAFVEWFTQCCRRLYGSEAPPE